MVAGLRVNQLSGNAHAIPHLAHAAFDQISNAKPRPDILYGDALSFEGERGMAGDDEQGWKTRQLGDDILRDAIGEILLFRIAAHIVERKHGNRWLFWSRAIP